MLLAYPFCLTCIVFFLVISISKIPLTLITIVSYSIFCLPVSGITAELSPNRLFVLRWWRPTGCRTLRVSEPTCLTNSFQLFSLGYNWWLDLNKRNQWQFVGPNWICPSLLLICHEQTFLANGPLVAVPDLCNVGSMLLQFSDKETNR